MSVGVAVEVENVGGEGEVDGSGGDKYSAIVTGLFVFVGVAVVCSGNIR